MYIEARTGGFVKKYGRLLWLALLLVGTLLRFVLYTRMPAGFNQDEASIGYEAWSLLHYGMDRNGNAWPALLTAWGSGQNVLYAYMLMPIIALFGLRVASVRLLAVAIGCLTLVLFHAFIKKLHGPAIALLGLALLALNPWHIMASRWALESNILPFFLLLGMYLLVLGLEKPWFLPLAAISFALCLYAYGSAFIILPFFFLFCFWYFYKRGALRPLPLVVAGVLFVHIVLPITLTNMLNVFGWDEMHLFGMTLPHLSETRQMETMGFDLLHNGKMLLQVLLYGEDGTVQSSLQRGMLYPGGTLLLAAAGCWRTLRTLRRAPQEDRGGALMLAMLAVGLVCSLFVDVNINRVNYLYLPILYMAAVGLAWAIRVVPRLRLAGHTRQVPQRLCVLAGAVWLLFSFGQFGGQYLSEGYIEELEKNNYAGLGAAINYAEEVRAETGADKVFITTHVNMPYIYALFYAQTPPGEYMETVRYYNTEGGFQFVKAFGHYEFDMVPGAGEEGMVYVLYKNQYMENMEHLAAFGEFVVTVAEK